MVELHANPGGQTSPPMATIRDAQSPALSSDGKTLAFLRETGGVKSAWIVSLNESGEVLAEPSHIGPAGVDVQDVGFTAQNTPLLIVMRDGSPHLWPPNSSSPNQTISSGSAAMGPPATHADNPMLVWQQRTGSYWQLFASTSPRGHAVQLSFGDCNAYAIPVGKTRQPRSM